LDTHQEKTVFLPFELFCVVAEVAFVRLIATIALAAGIGVLLTASRDLLASPPASVSGGGMVAARAGSVSVAQLSAMLVGMCCVLAGLFLWVR
jgi:ABC-type phosphate transport system permease subunit